MNSSVEKTFVESFGDQPPMANFDADGQIVLWAAVGVSFVAGLLVGLTLGWGLCHRGSPRNNN